MRHLKTYEALAGQEYRGGFYFIKGNRREVINVLTRLLKNYEDEFLLISNRIDGILIAIDKVGEWSYWEVEENDDINNGKDFYRQNNYEYRGQMFLKNNEIVIDSLDADLDKYNL